MIKSTRHTNCRACNDTLPPAFLDLDMQPLANNLCTETNHEDETFPLRLCRCSKCGLLQLDTIVDPSAMFSHYLYTPSQSKKMLEHFEGLADAVTEMLPEKGLSIDIGSNSGDLLGFLKYRGWKICGIDPAENLSKEANNKGLTTICDFLSPLSVQEVIKLHGKADLITACNVFAHTPDWQNFALCVDALLAPDGQLVIEFPYGPTMLSEGTADLCLLPGEKIVTINGLRSIEDVSVGDAVLTHLGRWRKVTKTFKRKYSGEIVNLKVWGQSTPLRLTPNHPVYTNQFVKIKNKIRKTREYKRDFVSAENLKNPDYVLRPQIHDSIATPSFLFTQYANFGQPTYRTIPMCEELAKLCGYYLAEGTHNILKRNAPMVAFCFGRSEEERLLAEDCLRCVHAIGSSGSIRLSKQPTWTVYTTGGLARFLHAEFGKLAEGKRIPGWVYTMPREWQDILLRAYMKGDGYEYRNKKYLRGGSVSTELAQGIGFIATSLGYPTSLCLQSNEHMRGKTIANNPLPTMNPLPSWDILVRVEPKQVKQKVFIEDGYQHALVKSVSKENYNGFVHNIEVEEDNSYTTLLGAVHNCYFEHHSAPSLTPLTHLFNPLNLYIDRVDYLKDIHGGSVRVWIGRADCSWMPNWCNPIIAISKYVQWKILNEYDEDKTCSVEACNDFVQKVNENLSDLREVIDKEKKNGRRIVGYTSPAKCVTLLIAAGLGKDDISCIVDDNPLKQDRYLPKLHIPVVSSSKAALNPETDTVIIFAWNVANDVLSKLPKGTRAIIPMPDVRIVEA